MASSYSVLVARVMALLGDASNVITVPQYQEAFRLALDEYAAVCPYILDTVITLPGAGREIALDSLTGLLSVRRVWWPFDSLVERWPPNDVKGFRLLWDDARPVLFLGALQGDEPRAGDEVRVWYGARHTISGLDGAAVTTILTSVHEGYVVTGAVAHACMAFLMSLDRKSGLQGRTAQEFSALADVYFVRFRENLAHLRSMDYAAGGGVRPTEHRLDEYFQEEF